METTENPWQTLNSSVKYENPWLAIRHEEVITPAGTPGIYGVVSFKNKAIGVVPIDSEGNTYLVGQYRYALNEYSWEIPEGGCPLGTDPLDSAKRELKEETGLEAAKWTKIARIHTSNSATDEEGFLYIAEELVQGEHEPEETEDLRVWKLPLAEAINMVMTSQITDSLSVSGLLIVARLRGI
ncbi:MULTISPECIES: NUDIX hydrolase [unclassified Spirosoma]|uniref:NUDIX domain-containing protein n=1 Tax=unclassified Spirosoma TaxID=2621999 RepID=UPI0009594315|nr:MULTISPECIES: NUDIX hydrolase [unclassified Spirosoma]MBN8826053.1 NUDIX hydrolase [Spirosoma sp.]OJW75564.1 MAG: DNA mismatch repair protein MutT [Spirosoma sp. 48-14]